MTFPECGAFEAAPPIRLKMPGGSREYKQSGLLQWISEENKNFYYFFQKPLAIYTKMVYYKAMEETRGAKRCPVTPLESQTAKGELL